MKPSSPKARSGRISGFSKPEIDYMLAAGTLPVEAQIFLVWYYALYPEKLNPEVDTTTHQRVFPMLPSKSRVDRKRALREVISSFRGDAELMTHPKTDPRPLILRAGT